MLSEKEKNELLRLAQSSSLRDDMRFVSAHRLNLATINGSVDLDMVITFLTGYNEFINHKHKPFKPMIDKIMKM
jgi:hypothetical protein